MRGSSKPRLAWIRVHRKRTLLPAGVDGNQMKRLKIGNNFETFLNPDTITSQGWVKFMILSRIFVCNQSQTHGLSLTISL